MADYTKLSMEEIHGLAAHYDIGDLASAVPLTGGQANSSFKLTTVKGCYTLSVCDEKSPDDVNTLTRILAYLEARQFPVTRLVRPVSGPDVLRHRGKPVYLKEYLDGEVIQDLDRPMMEQVGAAMARLHGLPAPKGVPGAFPYGLSRFDQVLDSDIAHPFKAWLREKTAYLTSRLDPDMPKGFIHGDLFWDNLLFDKGRLNAVLDFEEACRYFFLYDLGMAAVGCCACNGRFNADKVSWLLRGYQASRPFTAKETDQFIPFLVYAATAAAFWRFRQYNLRYPDPDLADHYQPLADLADQAPALALSRP